jgi:hypothetical protein
VIKPTAGSRHEHNDARPNAIPPYTAQRIGPIMKLPGSTLIHHA